MRCKQPLTTRESASRGWPLTVLLITATLVLTLAGCGHPIQQLPIQPGSSGHGERGFGLGPGVRPLSFGPGDKSSPAWSRSGDNIAFVVDGYVAKKTLGSRELRRQTTKNFGAEQVAWLPSGKALTILGTGLSSNSTPGSTSSDGKNPKSLYLTHSGTELLEIEKAADDVLSMDGSPGGVGLVVAMKSGPSQSSLALLDERGTLKVAHKARVEGEITGVSLSPDGKNAVLATQYRRRCRLYTFSFADKVFRRIADLRTGMEVLGSPQWTSSGIYYVAGKPTKTGNGRTSPYHLYQVSASSGNEKRPSLASSAGEDFAASSIQASPDGRRLAVIGRRSSGSSTNLYLLDPSISSLKPLTTNENMEIETGAGDLAWSPDGKHVAIVARGTLQGPEVYSAPANSLLKAFYNLYEVPVGPEGSGNK